MAVILLRRLSILPAPVADDEEAAVAEDCPRAAIDTKKAIILGVVSFMIVYVSQQLFKQKFIA
jgi:hypothetical protein